VVGILSMGSAHAVGASNTSLSWSGVRVLTGLSPTELKAAGIRPGSTGVPLRPLCGPVLFGNPVGGTSRVACFGHVRESSHGYEVARLSGFENVYRTLMQFITDWEG